MIRVGQILRFLGVIISFFDVQAFDILGCRDNALEQVKFFQTVVSPACAEYKDFCIRCFFKSFSPRMDWVEESMATSGEAWISRCDDDDFTCSLHEGANQLCDVYVNNPLHNQSVCVMMLSGDAICIFFAKTRVSIEQL